MGAGAASLAVPARSAAGARLGLASAGRVQRAGRFGRPRLQCSPCRAFAVLAPPSTHIAHPVYEEVSEARVAIAIQNAALHCGQL